MRPAVRTLAALAALTSLFSCALGGAAFVLGACASDEPSDPPALEAGGDGTLLGDVIAPDADADVPLGDLCGDSRGLEQDAAWPMRGGCPKRAGTSASIGPQNATLKWSVPAAVGDSSPAIGADRLLWVGSANGDVLVLSADGVVLGALRTGGAVRSSPARSATNLAIVGSDDGALYGVSRPSIGFDAGAEGGADGGAEDAGADRAGEEAGVPPAAIQVFRRPLAGSGAISSSPAIGADGTIYVGSSGGKLFAVAADGSAVKWTATTNDGIGSSPAVGVDGTIYVGSSDGKLYAFTRDGAQSWAYETGGPISSSPAIGGDDTIYIGSGNGQIHAVAPDGKRRWMYAAGGAITASPCVRGGSVYVGSEDKKLYALAAPSGALKWAFETLGAVATPVIDADGIVYAGSADGKLYALKPTGLLYFAVNAKGRIHSAPAIGDDGTLYVTTDTAIVAIGP